MRMTENSRPTILKSPNTPGRDPSGRIEHSRFGKTVTALGVAFMVIAGGCAGRNVPAPELPTPIVLELEGAPTTPVASATVITEPSPTITESLGEVQDVVLGEELSFGGDSETEEVEPSLGLQPEGEDEIEVDLPEEEADLFITSETAGEYSITLESDVKLRLVPGDDLDNFMNAFGHDVRIIVNGVNARYIRDASTPSLDVTIGRAMAQYTQEHGPLEGLVMVDGMYDLGGLFLCVDPETDMWVLHVLYSTSALEQSKVQEVIIHALMSTLLLSQAGVEDVVAKWGKNGVIEQIFNGALMNVLQNGRINVPVYFGKDQVEAARALLVEESSGRSGLWSPPFIK